MNDKNVRKHLQKTAAIRQIKRQAEQSAKTQSAHAAEATESTQESVNDYGSQKIEQAPEDATGLYCHAKTGAVPERIPFRQQRRR